jgi:hypothetical protein
MGRRKLDVGLVDGGSCECGFVEPPKYEKKMAVLFSCDPLKLTLWVTWTALFVGFINTLKARRFPPPAVLGFSSPLSSQTTSGNLSFV